MGYVAQEVRNSKSKLRKWNRSVYKRFVILKADRRVANTVTFHEKHCGFNLSLIKAEYGREKINFSAND